MRQEPRTKTSWREADVEGKRSESRRPAVVDRGRHMSAQLVFQTPPRKPFFGVPKYRPPRCDLPQHPATEREASPPVDRTIAAFDGPLDESDVSTFPSLSLSSASFEECTS